jgi:CheY-like chemotaxis protein
VKKRILLVEDHADTLDVVKKELTFLGYEITTAKNGLEAAELAESAKPDLVVMDLMLPKLSGFDASYQIRHNPKTQSIPILAATAKAMPGDREKCLTAGLDGYLAKPFTLVELGYAIEKLLKKRSSQDNDGASST